MFTFFYWIFAMSFAFDFKGDEGGSAVQYLFLATAISSGLLMVACTPSALRSRPTIFVTALWWFYLATTLMLALQSHVVPTQYLRCLLPPLLCGIGMLVGQCLATRRYQPEDLLKPLLYSGIVSVIWRAFHAIVIQHIPVDKVRYEMLSPAIPLLFAATAASMILAPKIRMLPLAGGVIAMTSVLISVTRSYILTLGVALLATGFVFVVTLAARWWTRPALGRKGGHLFFGIAAFAVMLAVLAAWQPVVFERWITRLFNDGGGRTSVEVTYLTREAEATAMWQILSDDPLSFIHGKGLGAEYYWHTSYFPELLAVYPDTKGIGSTIWVPGHSVWTYALFSGGVFAVACYAFLFGWLVIAGFKTGKAALKNGAGSPDLAFFPFIVGICYFSQTLTANPFGERFSAQVLGLCVAIPQMLQMRRGAIHRAPTTFVSAPLQPA